MHDLITPKAKRVQRRYLCALALGAALVAQCGFASEPAVLSLIILDAEGKPAANTVVIAPSLAAPKVDGVGPNSYSVDQVDLQFKPEVILVPTGKPVLFPNSDRTRHQVYSFSEPNNFELKLYREKDAPPVVFNAEGVVELGCNIHDSMKGYIYVSNASVQSVSDDQGRVSLALNSAPVGGIALLIWHPLMGAKGPSSYQYDSGVNGPIRLQLTLPGNARAKPSSLKDRLQQFKKNHD